MPETLREAIDKKFESQSNCARALKWPRQKLYRIVTGESMPTLADAEALSEVLEVSIDSISEKILTQKSRK